MGDFFHAAGPFVYIVMAVGVASLACAAKYAAAPRRDLLPLIIGLGLAALIIGGLNTVAGVQKSAGAIGGVPPGQHWIFLLGLQESLNNMMAAMSIVLIDVLLVMAGSYRTARRALAAA